jgi:hypothetical protein
MTGWLMIYESGKIWTNVAVAQSIYYSASYVEVLRDIMKALSYDSRSKYNTTVFQIHKFIVVIKK